VTLTPATVVAADGRVDEGRPDVDVDRWQQLAAAVLAAEGAQGELTLTFVDSTDIADLNATHMGATGPTDVLSFPIDEEPQAGVPTLLGDVVVCPAVAAQQHADHAGTLDD
jgi:probable rRNA maturation factor